MQPVEELMLKMADDALVIGHRNSEWTGLGPILEEDIAFSSMAQDKIGHAFALYNILHEQFGATVPDQLAFNRKEKEFRCCHFTELPIGGYDFSLVRHFLFDHAEAFRYELLSSSTFEPLARIARKIKGELKYHVLHANSWMVRLGNGTEEARNRIQTALDYAIPYALGIFEEGERESEIIDSGIFSGEKQLQEYWEERIREELGKTNLEFPKVEATAIYFGGRKGYHTEHLSHLLDEMSQVYRLEEKAEW